MKRIPTRTLFLLGTPVAAALVVLGVAAAMRPKPAFEHFPRWTTSELEGTPDAPLPYRAVRTFPELSFEGCVDMVFEPSQRRWFVVELDGKIWHFDEDRATKDKQVFLDLRQKYPDLFRLYSVAFHPRFADNGELFVFYWKTIDGPNDVHVSRFRTRSGDRLTVDLDSEELLLSWDAGSHEGTALEFGPDGYLYVSAGDGSPPWPADENQVGQDIGDLRASIMRIDVDGRDPGKAYAIPKDNPFVDIEGARGEIWAYGMRNPWKMSFDPETGALWAGDVGHVFWEEVLKIEKGGNYGWSLYEGPHPLRHDTPRPGQDTRAGAKPPASRKHGPTPVRPSILNLDHETGAAASVTGGHVYRGSALPELGGAYIFADYSLGTVWGLRETGGEVTWFEELADTKLGVVAIARDGAGELILVDFEGKLHRLEKNDQRTANADFPRKLSETGLFEDTAALRPAPGVLPYGINAPMWADGARGTRVVGVPPGQRIAFGEYIPPGAIHEEYRFPEGTVFAKTYSLQGVAGEPDTRRRIETQVLHLYRGRWQPYSYRWNDAQTDATLVAPEGGVGNYAVARPDDATPLEVRWRFASRRECQRCHNRFTGFVNAFSVAQLDREFDHGSARGDQLTTLRRIGFTEDKALKERLKDWLYFERMADPYDPAADENVRARSYLDVNCRHCHNAGTGVVAANLTFELDLLDTAVVDALPSQGVLGLEGARVLRPGDALASMIYYRMAKQGAGRMPHIGSRVVDAEGLRLMRDWIDGMPPLDPEAPEAQAPAPVRAQVAQLARGEGDADATIDALVSTPRGALALVGALDGGRLSPETRTAVVAAAVAGPPVTADLFTRFAGPEQARHTLGQDFDPEELLNLAGDPARGRALFRSGAALCNSCHLAEGQGGALGPAIADIAPDNARDLLTHVIDPSRSIAAGFVATGGRSPMPEGLLAGLTAQQAANLLGYVLSQRAPQPAADAGATDAGTVDAGTPGEEAAP